MDGIAIMRELLVANSALIALVPEDRIAAGVMPLKTQMTAIAINSVSAVDRNIIAPGVKRRVTERVQVTVMAPTFPEKKAVLRAVKAAAADFIGEAAGMTEVAIHTDSAGPDVMDAEASIHIGSQDFMVGFSEPR